MHGLNNDIMIEIILYLGTHDILSILRLNKKNKNLDINDLWIKLIDRDFSTKFDIKLNKRGYIKFYKFLNLILPNKSYVFGENKACIWNHSGLELMYKIYKSLLFNVTYLLKNFYYNGGAPIYSESTVYNLCQFSDKDKFLINHLNMPNIRSYRTFVTNSLCISSDGELMILEKLINTPEMVWFRNNKGKICKRYVSKSYSLAKDLYDEICNL